MENGAKEIWTARVAVVVTLVMARCACSSWRAVRVVATMKTVAQAIVNGVLFEKYVPKKTEEWIAVASATAVGIARVELVVGSLIEHAPHHNKTCKRRFCCQSATE